MSDSSFEAVAPIAAGSSSSRDRRPLPEPMELPAATAAVIEETCQEDAFLPSEDLDEMAAEGPGLADLAGWLEQARESLKRGGEPRPRLLRMRPRAAVQQNFSMVEAGV